MNKNFAGQMANGSDASLISSPRYICRQISSINKTHLQNKRHPFAPGGRRFRITRYESTVLQCTVSNTNNHVILG
jgi:hypothetical protein